MHRPSPVPSVIAHPSDGDLSLRVLGEPALERGGNDGARERILGLGKPLALLTYLSVVPQHEASREFLADLLWGDDSVSDPLHSLRNVLLQLSKQVDATLIEASPTRCRLTRVVASDLGALTQALGAHELERAMGIYTGEFLPNFAAPGCRQFEQWSDSVRVRVRTDVANAADVLVRQLLDAGRARDAEGYARRMIEIDPLHQRGRRVLLETLIASGDRMAAITEAAVTEQWLAAEEIEPEAATTAMLQQARRARPALRTPGEPLEQEPPETLEASTDLVGRAEEFGAIIASWDAARAGITTMVSVVAGAGIGKTRLLSDVENRLRAQRSQVVSLRALTDERDVPFSFVAALAGALARLQGAAAVSPATSSVLVGLDSSLGLVFRSLADFAPTDQVLRRARALQELLACVADERTTVLLLDDLHWADDASLAVLPAIFARLTASRVLVVTASRPGRGAVLASERTKRLSLSPLSAEQVGQLVASIRPLPLMPWAETLVQGIYLASHGVPVYVLLALRDATMRGVVRIGEATWECDDPAPLDASLRDGAALASALRDLPRQARRVLLRLAVAGRGLPVEMLADVGESAPSLALPHALEALERRALIVRIGDLVSPAHDVVAESALEGASDTERRAAARSVALEMLGRDDRRWQERGVRLLSTVATASDLAPWMVKFVRDATLPIGVPLAKALGTWLGDSPEQRRLARDVARRLPVSLRIRPFRRHLGLTGLTVSVLAAIPLWNITQHATPVDATLVRVVATGDSATMAFAVPLSMAGWDASTLIDGRPASPYAGASSLYDYPQTSPLLQSTGERLSEHAYSDSGGSDIDVIAVNGRVTRVTSAPGDDVPDAWSPDGQFIAFHSSRWSVLRHHRLGILDRATGAVRRLTRSDGREGIAMWSPDGSRIAFVRDYLDGRPTQMCIIGIDGDDERCTTFVASILGWRDPQAIMMYGGNRLLVLHPGRSLAIDTLISTTGSPTLSPNGRWLAWWTGTASGSVGVVAPSSDPQEARRIRWGRTMQAPGPLLWGARGVPAPYVERLSVSSMNDTVFVGVPHRFELVAKWSDSTESTPPYVRWRVGAAGDGTIDSAGTLVAARPGTIVVVASAGGWRTTSTRVVAVAATTQLVASEHWGTGFTDWRPFGDPLPTVVHDPLMGAAVLNNGDGSYFSGVYHKGTLRSERGLAIDAVISTAVTALQWQTIDLHLYAAMDREALDAWDHRTGFLPAGRRPPGADCLFSYPGSEGIDGLATIVPLPGPTPGAERRPLRLANGTPYRVRLQVFPDGRCGMAVNGAALFISRGRFARDATLRLVSYGNSWKTRMLLGPLAILTGVPGDVDWTHVVRDIPPVMPPGPVRPP